MVKWLRSVGTIPVFHRKALKHRSIVPPLQWFRPWFCVFVYISYKIYFSMNSEAFHILCTAKCGQKRRFNIVQNVGGSIPRAPPYVIRRESWPVTSRRQLRFSFFLARPELVSSFILFMFICLEKWGYRWNQQNFFFPLVYLARNVQVVHWSSRSVVIFSVFLF